MSNLKHRQGYTLVVFVMFMVCLFAFATLVIDLGFVRLAKRQMQTMTDGSALDLQRVVDSDLSQPFEMSDVGPTLTFDDDGVVIAGGFRAQPKLGSNSPGHWTPSLQSPQENATDDILVGNYQGSGERHAELAVDSAASNYYDRPDFDIASDGADVLVRLRRTGEELPAGGSAGPPVPFLFGRGVVVGGSADLWQRIERGTIVRQASIARQSPARTAGPYLEYTSDSGETVAVVGLINVQVERSTWQLAGDAPISMEQFETFDAGQVSQSSLGDLAKAESAASITSMDADSYHGNYPTDSAYVTIIDTLASGGQEKYVVGFGYVKVDHINQQITRISAADPEWRRGFFNTSAVFRPSADLTSEQWGELVTANRSLLDDDDGITAPALVRSEE